LSFRIQHSASFLVFIGLLSDQHPSHLSSLVDNTRPIFFFEPLIWEERKKKKKKKVNSKVKMRTIEEI
jgi:hypothetical protein